ncbi:hypothetical protein P43SY_011013 [Pythium insidiosum]|uniref:Uncharacterized protein n=1 Tax=Pythium insidiosum TaxID=114742 RepID=A0AAD5LZI3_PYTIN|nr:hypothetical protein P43SY_011013 [Pythium insidiosum]
MSQDSVKNSSKKALAVVFASTLALTAGVTAYLAFNSMATPVIQRDPSVRRLREHTEPTAIMEAQRHALHHSGLETVLEAHGMPSGYERNNNGGGRSASERRNSRSAVAAMEAHGMPSGYERNNNGAGHSASERRNSHSVVAVMEAHGMPSGYERSTNGAGHSANERRNSHSVVAVMEAHAHAQAHARHHN